MCDPACIAFKINWHMICIIHMQAASKNSEVEKYKEQKQITVQRLEHTIHRHLSISEGGIRSAKSGSWSGPNIIASWSNGVWFYRDRWAEARFKIIGKSLCLFIGLYPWQRLVACEHAFKMGIFVWRKWSGCLYILSFYFRWSMPANTIRESW